MTPRALLLFGGGALLVAAAVASLATGNWLFFAGALLLHFVGFSAVMLPVFKALGQGDKPDPVTEARMDEEDKESDEGQHQPAL